MSGPKTGGGRHERCRQGTREEGGLAQTDREERPTVAHQRSIERDSQAGRYYSCDHVENWVPKTNGYDVNGPQCRAQRHQLQTKDRGQTEEGANYKVWHGERVGVCHLQRAKHVPLGESGALPVNTPGFWLRTAPMSWRSGRGRVKS